MQEIWDRKWLTNSGAFHKELEAHLARHLDVPYVALCTNGTLALLIALQVLRVTGEVITTSFSGDDPIAAGGNSPGFWETDFFCNEI